MTPAELADQLRATVYSSGGTVRTDRPDFWRAKDRGGVTVAEICNQPTVTRLNYKGADVNPVLADLVRRHALEYATEPKGGATGQGVDSR